jgi:transcription termination/antitermination protein NusG
MPRDEAIMDEEKNVQHEAASAAATDGATAPAEAPGDGGAEAKLPMRWYVVHTYSGHENKVRENIQKMINASSIQDHFGQIVVPTEEVAEMKKGKKSITTRKFFPSYILIEMHMSDESFHLVNDLPGVTGFVGTPTAQPLSKPEVERILGRMDKEKQTIIPEIPFTLGEHIRIKDGPFSDFTGVIDEINAERGKLRVLVSIFGRETPVELDFLQVENI